MTRLISARVHDSMLVSIAPLPLQHISYEPIYDHNLSACQHGVHYDTSHYKVPTAVTLVITCWLLWPVRCQHGCIEREGWHHLHPSEWGLCALPIATAPGMMCAQPCVRTRMHETRPQWLLCYGFRMTNQSACWLLLAYELLIHYDLCRRFYITHRATQHDSN